MRVFINKKRTESHTNFLKETGLTANLPQKKK